MDGTQENPLSNITKLQHIQRGRTNIGISTSKETKYSQQRVQNIQMLNSYVENITRAWCGHLKNPKHVESTYELVQTSAHNLLKFKCKSGSAGRSFGGHNEQAPLRPMTKMDFMRS
jgi:hypothetical protein